MQLLPLVGDVDHLVGMICIFPVLDGGQIRGGIQSRPIGLEDDAGGHLLAVGFLGDIYDQGAVALVGIAVLFHLLRHAGNDIIDRGLSVPEVKGHIQSGVVALHIRYGDRNDLVPEGTQAPVALLQAVGRFHGPGVIVRILFGFFAGIGIDLLQFGDRKGSLLRIVSAVIGIKIGKVRLTVLELSNDKAHLQAPVAQMDVADDLFTVIAADPLDGFTDDSGTQVSYMQGLGHIGAAVIQDDPGRSLLRGHAETVRVFHLHQISGQEGFPYLQIDETGTYHLYRGEHL